MRRSARRPLAQAAFVAAFLSTTQAVYPAVRSDERAHGIESVSGRAMREDADRPIAAIFDVHGTLVESTWKDTYARVYEELTGTVDHPAAVEWVQKRLIGKSETQMLELLAAESGKPIQRVEESLSAARDHYRFEHIARAVAGARQFIAALHARGVPIVIQSDGDRDVIVRQLKKAGFFDYLKEDDILGRDDMAKTAPGGVFTDEHRDTVIERLALKYPGHDFVHFNDSFTGFAGIEKLGGINVGIAAGQGREYEINRSRLVRHGADFIMGQTAGAWDAVRRRLFPEDPHAPAVRSKAIESASWIAAGTAGVVLAAGTVWIPWLLVQPYFHGWNLAVGFIPMPETLASFIGLIPVTLTVMIHDYGHFLFAKKAGVPDATSFMRYDSVQRPKRANWLGLRDPVVHPQNARQAFLYLLGGPVANIAVGLVLLVANIALVIFSAFGGDIAVAFGHYESLSIGAWLNLLVGIGALIPIRKGRGGRKLLELWREMRHERDKGGVDP